MPEARDRLSRAADVAALYARRRSSILCGVNQDMPELDRALASPIHRSEAASPVVRGRGNLGTPRGLTVGGRNMFGTASRERENPTIGSLRRGNGYGRSRPSNSRLPSWYPRTPLRDITAIVRAIERRRESLEGSRAQEIEIPMSIAYGVEDSGEPSPVAHLEHSNTFRTPVPRTALKRCPPTVSKVPKILLSVAHKASEDSGYVTPQKKLLNSIDTVEKEVMAELGRLKRTASAKKEERDKKVKTLMSLR